MGSRRTSVPAHLRVLFCVAGGPKRGFGHVVRAVRLASALGVPAVLRVRGAASSQPGLDTLKVSEVTGPLAALLSRRRFDVVVVDDPNADAARRAIRIARRAGAISVSVHDLGIGCHDADLVIDGSIRRIRPVPADRSLVGLRYAVLDPGLATRRSRRRSSTRARILVALGGGRRKAIASRLARVLATRLPEAHVRIAGGFSCPAGNTSTGGRSTTGEDRIVSLPSLPTLHEELAAADVAVVGGGVSLYEAAALGVASVAVAVAETQRPTIESFAREGATLDGGRLFGAHATAAALDALVSRVSGLLADATARRRLGDAGRCLVDGRGAARVARAIVDRAESRALPPRAGRGSRAA